MIGSASVPFSAVLTSCCSDAGSIRRVIASPVFYFGPADLYFGGGAIRRTSAREAGRTRDFNRLVPANRQFPPGQADAPSPASRRTLHRSPAAPGPKVRRLAAGASAIRTAGPTVMFMVDQATNREA